MAILCTSVVLNGMYLKFYIGPKLLEALVCILLA